MTNQKSDHDLLLEIKTHVEYIRNDIKKANKERISLFKKTEECKEWRDTMSTKMKIAAGIATFVGGAIVFVTDKLINFWSKK